MGQTGLLGDKLSFVLFFHSEQPNCFEANYKQIKYMRL